MCLLGKQSGWFEKHHLLQEESSTIWSVGICVACGSATSLAETKPECIGVRVQPTNHRSDHLQLFSQSRQLAPWSLTKKKDAGEYNVKDLGVSSILMDTPMPMRPQFWARGSFIHADFDPAFRKRCLRHINSQCCSIRPPPVCMRFMTHQRSGNLALHKSATKR